MENVGVLSPAGADFLIAALDPMHDNQLKNLVGWPDVETTASVVRCVKQSVTIRKPAAIVGTWDAHIIQWPWLQSQAFRKCTRVNQQIDQYNINARPYFGVGGLEVYGVAAGTDLTIDQTPANLMTLPDEYCRGASRVLGMGIEAVNTTSELYKQGQVFVWRQPNSRVSPTGFSTFITEDDDPDTELEYRAFDGLTIDSPPLSTAQAMLIPGTRQWAAADGSYQVVPHVGQDNPPALVNYTQPVIHLTVATDSPQGNATNASLPTNFNSTLVAVPTAVAHDVIYYLPPFNIYPVHQTGAIYAGLSAETTLSLTWNVFIETFPTVADKSILVLATPSAEYDPLALQMYSHALNRLPVGVPSDWNGFGDWFADVVSTVTDFLTPGALALGMPGIAAVSAGAGKLAKGYLKQNNAKEKKQYLTSPSPKSTPVVRTIPKQRFIGPMPLQPKLLRNAQPQLRIDDRKSKKGMKKDKTGKSRKLSKQDLELIRLVKAGYY